LDSEWWVRREKGKEKEGLEGKDFYTNRRGTEASQASKQATRKGGDRPCCPREV
jgi:hypothetical protein